MSISPEFQSLEELTALSILASETEENNEGVIGQVNRPYNVALARRREELGLTQEQLAEQIGVSGSLIGHLETLRWFPNPDIKAKLIGVLGIDPCPKWLRIFTRNRKQPAQIIVEVPESKVNPLLLRRAYEIETTLTAIDPQEVAEDSERKEKILDMLNSLSRRYRQVLSLRLGFDGEDTHTLDEVGQIFGVTSERIRQIEASAYRKLRHPSRNRPLKELLDDQPGDPNNPRALTRALTRALINGAISAFYQGDYERAQGNLDKILDGKTTINYEETREIKILRAKMQKD